MHDEQTWANQGEAQDEAYRYFMRPDPDMKEHLGPIEKIDDPVTGREMRTRSSRIAMMRGMTELKDVTVYLDPYPHVRLDKGQDLRGWYASKSDAQVKGSRERPCMTDAILTQPYGGFCQVGCVFCYINSGSKGYRGTGLVSVPMGYGNQVARQLKSMMVSQAGYFTSFHDPFNKLEDYYHNTQDGVRAFTNEGLPVFFLSRLSYPDWAIDALRLNKFSYAQKSLNTPDPEDWKKLSPGALPLMSHFEEIRKLKAAGIYVSIQVNPIIPGIVTHEDIEKLIDMLAEAGADHAIFKFVEANHPWAKAMEERVTKKFGDNRAAGFRELFKENSCGAQRTITEEYRREGMTRYRKRCNEVGMTMSLCYEYTKITGEWKSMGPEFITSDQCHGQRVPMHVRPGPGQAFAPLGECPPSGCLSCSDTNAGVPRCGSELLGSAKALRIADLRRDPFGGMDT